MQSHFHTKLTILFNSIHYTLFKQMNNLVEFLKPCSSSRWMADCQEGQESFNALVFTPLQYKSFPYCSMCKSFDVIHLLLLLVPLLLVLHKVHDLLYWWSWLYLQTWCFATDQGSFQQKQDLIPQGSVRCLNVYHALNCLLITAFQ